MARSTSPLRYPGGKTCLHEMLSSILRLNGLEYGHYIEPYAGGCGLALSLLFEGHVSDIHVNDLDRSIWSFWHSVLNESDALIELVQQTPVTIEEWRRQREILFNPAGASTLKLGFSTFFLNRTNRSGVIKRAGVIGGLEQTGDYKIDCRFNRNELARRIKRVSRYKGQIHLTNMDAIDFLRQCEGTLSDDAFYCIDPPYYKKGFSLYTNFYGPHEHAAVAGTIIKLARPWIVTYDCAKEIARLYSTQRKYIFDINYSLQTKRVGTELLIASKGLRLPEEVKRHPAKMSDIALAD
jgi:DNA adenine methylase